METIEYRGHELSSTFDHAAGILTVTVKAPAGATEELTRREAADVAYWFAYSNLGTGPGIESRGTARNADGSVTVTFRV